MSDLKQRMNAKIEVDFALAEIRTAIAFIKRTPGLNLKKIDLGTLDIEDIDCCPLAQASGMNFNDATGKFHLDAYTGFTCDPEEVPLYNRLWREELTVVREDAH